MFEINNFSFSFGSRKVLNNFFLAIPSGQIVALIGASGCGKTTLFKMLTKTLVPQEGSFLIDGQPVVDVNQHISYMTQEDLLLPWRTILENLMLIAELGRKQRPKAEWKEMALAYLKEVGLQGWEDSYPDQLSGGMRQRVSLARALLQKTSFLLLDEPFSALDINIREEMYELIRNIRTQHGTTILMAIHDFRDAITFADRICLLSNGSITADWLISHDALNTPQFSQQLYEEIRANTRSARSK